MVAFKFRSLKILYNIYLELQVVYHYLLHLPEINKTKTNSINYLLIFATLYYSLKIVPANDVIESRLVDLYTPSVCEVIVTDNNVTLFQSNQLLASTPLHMISLIMISQHDHDLMWSLQPIFRALQVFGIELELNQPYSICHGRLSLALKMFIFVLVGSMAFITLINLDEIVLNIGNRKYYTNVNIIHLRQRYWRQLVGNGERFRRNCEKCHNSLNLNYCKLNSELYFVMLSHKLN